MSVVKYHYNPKTFQYERARITIKDVMWYISGLLFTGLLLCGGTIVIRDSLIESDTEQALRLENELLKKHKPVLVQQLSEVEGKLIGLKEDDEQLYTRLFNSKPPESSSPISTLSKGQVLLADVSEFRTLLDVLKTKSEKLKAKSAESNSVFGYNINITRDKLGMLGSIPSLQPIANDQLDLLVSGFGERINPFHKGNYTHPGIDFAAPRGTSVFVTAPGRVTALNRTNLQAGYGNYIEVTHGNGFVTRYAHLEDITIKKGQTVVKGQVIGTVGSSGGSVAPHLHYEVIRDGEPVDPIQFLLEGLTSEQYTMLIQLGMKQNQSLD
ncbi:MAG: peptidase M23 [Marivirga sp.]|nr:peptidase M23 [Marivirga sp.]